MAKTKKNLDYTKVAQNIIANIGGKENVNSVQVFRKLPLLSVRP